MLSPRPGGEGRVLTDGHVVATVREIGVPITELGLVAAAGTLGLTGHWVRHGCGGGRLMSEGSLAAPPGSSHPCRPSLCRAGWAGPPGRPLRGHHCAPFPSATSEHRHPSLSHCSCLLHFWLSWGWGAPPARLGKGGRHMWAGPRRAAASSGPGVLGSRISGALWGASRRRLSSKPRCPGEGSGQIPGTRRVAGPSSGPTFSFHVVVHLKLHLAGPEEVALGTAEVATVIAV